MTTDASWIARTEAAAARAGRTPLDVELLPPHASTRRYARVRWTDDTSWIAMLFPESDGSDEAGGPTGEGVVNSAFARAQRWLAKAGVPVPEVFAADEAQRVLWLEDLGGLDFDRWTQRQPARTPCYERALELLDLFQRATAEAIPADVSARCFDRQLLAWELEHYVEWRLEAALGLTVTASQRAGLNEGFGKLLDRLEELPSRVVHRDFQSHNIMVAGPEQRLVLLDFQDAMLGSFVYDAVALLRDSYVELTQSELDALLERFARRVRTVPGCEGISVHDAQTAFHLQTLQRKLKDAGRFVYIDRVRNNPSFLQFIPSSMRYVASALEHLRGFDDLTELLVSLDPDLA